MHQYFYFCIISAEVSCYGAINEFYNIQFPVNWKNPLILNHFGILVFLSIIIYILVGNDHYPNYCYHPTGDRLVSKCLLQLSLLHIWMTIALWKWLYFYNLLFTTVYYFSIMFTNNAHQRHHKLLYWRLIKVIKVFEAEWNKINWNTWVFDFARPTVMQWFVNLLMSELNHKWPYIS